MTRKRARGELAPAAAEPAAVDEPRMDDFLVSQCNALAHSACMTVLEAPGTRYTPLFLHGGPGTGKTHLAGALAAEFQQRYPHQQAEFLTGERFVESYVRAAEMDELPSFRQWFRNLDALVIDDVAYVAGKTRSEEELFHTIDALIDAERQVVLTARTGPRLLTGLAPRLASRCQGGLVVQIDPPDVELRRRILEAEALERGWRLSRASLDLLAERLPGNARELRGAVVRLQANERLTGEPVTRRGLETTLKESQADEQTSQLERIVHAVLRRFNLRLRQLQSRKRSRAIATPRHIAMHLAREMTSMSLEEIGAYFGGRDHTTVLHACRKINQMAVDDPAIAGVLREIQDDLQRQ